MAAAKIMANYKCDCYTKGYCTCQSKDEAKSLFLDNVNDVADTIAEVMEICGIHPCKAHATTEVVRHAFEHYDEVRHRVDSVPRKRLSREDFIHDLGLKCMMSRMEAQLCYSITKRAFKAFYHGTCEGGIQNPLLESQLIHSQECMWVHAARRTAQIFATYEGMFLSAQRNYEALIRCAYKRLYERLLTRYTFTSTGSQQPQSVCDCRSCMKAINYGQDDTAKMEDAERQILGAIGCNLTMCCQVLAPNDMAQRRCEVLEEERQQQWSQKAPGENPVSFCQPCKCPRLVCDCNAVPGIPSLECSQGPYVCRWLPVTADDEIESNASPREEHHECPVDCVDTEEESCDTECICDCEASCECEVEDVSSDYEFAGGEEDLYDFTGDDQDGAMSEGQTYAGCCVMLNHIAEEIHLADHSVSEALIEGTRHESSTRTEASPDKPSTTTIVLRPRASKPSQSPKGKAPPPPPQPLKPEMSEEEQKRETAEINKLLASMI